MSTLVASNLQASGGGGTAATLASINGGPISGARNRIINGDHRIDQRNAGASGTAVAYTTDRWVYASTQASKITWQQNAGSVTPPAGFTHYFGLTTTSAFTPGSADVFSFRQIIEGYNVSDLAFGTASAKQVTLSFWVRSSLTGTFGGSIENGAENRAATFSYAISAANTWEYKSVTISGDTAGTWVTNNGSGMHVCFSLGCGSTLQAATGSWSASQKFTVPSETQVVATLNATWYVTGVQLEVGSVATPFERRSFAAELQLCERYYEKSYPVDVAPGTNTGDANAALMAVALNGADFYTYGSMRFRQTKRVIPTFTFYNPVTGQAGGYRGVSDATNNAATAGAAFIGHTGAGRVYATSSNMTGGYVYAYHYTASAEL